MEHSKNKSLIFWAKLKNGDVNALGDLYDLYADVLFVYGMQFFADKNQVMDAIHDLFLNLYKYRNNLADTDNVSYYLCRSLKNTILKTSSEKFLVVHIEQQKSSDKSIEDHIIQEELQSERSFTLAKAVNVLSKTQKKGLFLRFTEEYSYEEIADIMDVSVQTSRTIIYRAIKTLRKELLLLIYFFSLFKNKTVYIT